MPQHMVCPECARLDQEYKAAMLAAVAADQALKGCPEKEWPERKAAYEVALKSRDAAFQRFIEHSRSHLL